MGNPFSSWGCLILLRWYKVLESFRHMFCILVEISLFIYCLSRMVFLNLWCFSVIFTKSRYYFLASIILTLMLMSWFVVSIWGSHFLLWADTVYAIFIRLILRGEIKVEVKIYVVRIVILFFSCLLTMLHSDFEKFYMFYDI